MIWHAAAAAAAAAKSLQSCPTLCDPIDGSPPGSAVPGILQARTLEWVAISFSNACKWKVKVKSLSRVRLLATPWTAAYQAPPSMGFFQARVLEWGAIAFSNDLTYISSNDCHKFSEHPSSCIDIKLKKYNFFLFDENSGFIPLAAVITIYCSLNYINHVNHCCCC